MSITCFIAISLRFNESPEYMFYTLSLHDALPISTCPSKRLSSTTWPRSSRSSSVRDCGLAASRNGLSVVRSEEHTYELQSRFDLVCRLLLEKKNRLDRGRLAPLLWRYLPEARRYN